MAADNSYLGEEELGLGQICDAAPRPLPVRAEIQGAHVVLEPLEARHADDLWREAQGADASWTYLRFGPFASQAELLRFIETRRDTVIWAVRPKGAQEVAGWAALLDADPVNASIEAGHLWFGPSLQRTRAATEALFLIMRYALEELGYYRLTWKCHNGNEASHRAAKRLGFRFEGVLRAHWVMKQRRRDSAFYSMLGDEWPICGEAMRLWSADENFASDGSQRRSLAEIRSGLGG